MSDERKAMPPEFGQARERFLAMVADLRPELHRYCARLVGSVVDGEDIVQETLAKAFYAVSMATEAPALRPWLFRIAHNTALDFLRRYEHRNVELRADLGEIEGSADDPLDPELLRGALSSFVDLPVSQRSAVILKDVLGHSLEQTADTMGATIPAVKAALVRGRAALRARRAEAHVQSSALQGPSPGKAKASALRAEQEQLQRYVALFNGRDWDALRALMAEECQLDLVSKAARRGKEVRDYFSRYAALPEVRLALGTLEGRPALFVTMRGEERPAYFILIEWSGDEVALIRDYRYVPYVAGEAEYEIN